MARKSVRTTHGRAVNMPEMMEGEGQGGNPDDAGKQEYLRKKEARMRRRQEGQGGSGERRR
ncbi:MAG TPA: hypothetical protein VLG67_01985 [Candidatus Saccharimonadales bacterium]|nr:hypothetical protein [Candidatus Saccharimonadales bacterium]